MKGKLEEKKNEKEQTYSYSFVWDLMIEMKKGHT